MWTFILSILVSLIATGIGITGAWFYNRKRRIDETTNQIERLRNDIKAVNNDIKAVNDQMANGFEKTALETETVISLFDSTKKEMEQAHKEIALSQKEFYQSIIDRLQAETVKYEELRKQVSENKSLIERMINIMEQNIARNFSQGTS